MMDSHIHIKTHFLKVYDTYANSIFRFCLVKTSNHEKAQDLTQEVFMRLWQALREGKKFTNERAFLYAVARNLVIDWYRKKKEISLEVLAESGFDPSSDDHIGIVQNVEFKYVMDVVGQLEDAYRDVVVLRYIDGLQPKEIAEILEESVNVVSVRINRAIKKLQDLIQ